MKNGRVVLGFAPWAAQDVPQQDAQHWRERLIRALEACDVEVIDLFEAIQDNFLRTDADAHVAVQHFRDNHVDGVFYPQLGKDCAAFAPQMAKALMLPSLLWNGRADALLAPEAPQALYHCGAFETAKLFTRMGLAFSLLESTYVDDPKFENGLRCFAAACAVVARLRNLRVLQIAPRDEMRPALAVNENELLRFFGISCIPVPISRLSQEMDALVYKRGADWAATQAMIERKMDCGFVPEEATGKLAAMYLALMRLCQQYECTAIAIPCGDSLREALGVYPCAVAGLLTQEGLVTVCDADVHGAISAVMLQQACAGVSPVFFARLAGRHPQRDDAALLCNCGNAPVSLAHPSTTPVLSDGPGRDGCFGRGQWRLLEGNLTLCRFDGENGRYGLFATQTQTCDGPRVDGVYTWIQTPVWGALEQQLLRGGYAPSFACVHACVLPVLREACRFIDGLHFDGYAHKEYRA
jgi:hypothetical protein